MREQSFVIGERTIGPGCPSWIIAEVGINHEGSVETCAKMIEAFVAAGADAIKLQTIDADASYDPCSPSYELFKRSSLTRDETAKLFQLTRDLGAQPMTTAADFATIDWVDALEPAAHKVSSGLLTTTPIVRYLASKGRPMIMSTGMALEADIDQAVATATTAGATDLVILHCTSVYPTPLESVNLATLTWLQERWPHPIGFSDHTPGDEAAALAIAFGARVIEKHVSLDRSRADFDHRLSLEPEAFRTMVEKIRRAETMIGTPGRNMTEAELEVRKWAHRVLVVTDDLAAGDRLSEQTLGYKRPPKDLQSAIPASSYDDCLGRRLARDVGKGAFLTPDDLGD